MLDRGQLEISVETGAQRLHDAQDAIYKAHLAAERAERDWELLCAKETEAMEQEFEGKRMPGADIRRARILTKHGTSESFISYRETQAKLKAMEAGVRLLAGEVNALQSLLKGYNT